MSAREQEQRELPWTTAEKNYMLAEIIKASYPTPQVLLGVINNLGIHQPRWDEIPLPFGRSLKSCRGAFDELRRTPGVSALHAPLGPLTPSPMSAHGPVNLKRPYPYEGSFPAGREIRPKPSTPGNGYSQMTAMEHPQKKKRGRPTKAEALAKAEAQIVVGGSTPRSEGDAPLSAGLAVPETAETQSPVFKPPLESPRPSPLPPSRMMPISSIITPTVLPSIGQSSSSPGNGKRKRARSARSESEQFSIGEVAGARQMEEYESQYTPAYAASPDTPARTTVLRHKEEDEQSFRPPSTEEPALREQPTSRSDPDPR